MKHARPDYDTIQDLSIARALARLILTGSDDPVNKTTLNELACHVLSIPQPPEEPLSILTQTLLEEEAPKIPVDEPVFLLRAQDRAAPATLRYWVEAARNAGASQDILQVVLDHSRRMEAWPTKKIPDLPKTKPFNYDF